MTRMVACFTKPARSWGLADRIFQNGFDPVTAPTTATKYVYLGSHLVAKARTTAGATQVFYQHTDALGTPVAQTDVSKNIIGTSTYQPLRRPLCLHWQWKRGRARICESVR